MELKEILAISGNPGLYKYVAQGKGGIIVEALADGKRTMVSGSSKVSALGDIAIFTEDTEVSLGVVFQAIFDNNKGAQVDITGKSTPQELAAFMKGALPEYDQERVHNSDIKKLAQWYNILAKAGMTSFLVEEEGSEDVEAAPAQEVEEAHDAKKTATKAPKATAAKALATAKAPKAAPKSTGAASTRAKGAAKSTANRKSGI